MSNPIYPTDQVILARETRKVLAEPGQPWPLHADQADWEQTVRSLLQLAARAPHHYPSHEVHRMNNTLASIVPWRAYVLDERTCRKLLQEFQEREINGGKITRMLAAARSLIQVTWLPDPGPLGEEELFQGTRRNMEHTAAAAAAIQNILLGATARGIPTYWSSGGKLRDQPFPELLGIPDTEVLLGSIFLFPRDISKAEVKPGALRGKGGELKDWSRWVEL